MASARRGPRAGTSAGRAGQRERPGRLRDEAQAGENRAESPPFLQVQRHQQNLGGAEGADRDEGEVGPGDAAVFEQGQVEQRRPGPALPDHERGQQQGREPAEQRRLGGLQGVAGPDDGQDEQGDPGRHGHGARDIQLPPAPRLVWGQQPHRGDQQRDADRDVDEEDQPPGGLDQQAAEHRAGREARRDNRAVGAQGAAAFLLPGPTGDQQGQTRGRQHGRSDPLHHPGGDQQARLDGQTPGDARRDEHHQADPVHPGPAVDVGEPPAQQQEPAEGDRVGADQPLQRRGGDVQLTLYRGQRDVDDGEVQHDHELRHRQRQQQRGPRTRPDCRSLGRAVTRPALVRARPGIPATGWDRICWTWTWTWTWTWHGHGGTFHHRGANPPQRPARAPVPAAAPADRGRQPQTQVSTISSSHCQTGSPVPLSGVRLVSPASGRRSRSDGTGAICWRG